MRIAIFDNEEWTDRHKSGRGCFEMLFGVNWSDWKAFTIPFVLGDCFRSCVNHSGSFSLPNVFNH